MIYSSSMFVLTRFLLLVCLAFLLVIALFPTPTEAKITYIKPLWQPVSEWSPPEVGRCRLTLGFHF